MSRSPGKEDYMRRRKAKSDPPPRKLTRGERKKQEKPPPKARGGHAAAQHQAKPMDAKTARGMASGMGSTMDYDPNKRDVTSWEDMQGKPERKQYDTPPKAQDFIDEANQARKAARKEKWGKSRKQAGQERRQAAKQAGKRGRRKR